MLAESRRAWMFCARQRNYLRILFDTDREASGLLAKTVASFASIGIPPRLIHVRRECWPGPCEVAGFNIWNYNKNPEDSHAKPNRTLDSTYQTLEVVRGFQGLRLRRLRSDSEHRGR